MSIFGKNGLKVVDLNRRKAIRERCSNFAGWSYKDEDSESGEAFVIGCVPT